MEACLAQGDVVSLEAGAPNIRSGPGEVWMAADGTEKSGSKSRVWGRMEEEQKAKRREEKVEK